MLYNILKVSQNLMRGKGRKKGHTYVAKKFKNNYEKSLYFATMSFSIVFYTEKMCSITY